MTPLFLRLWQGIFYYFDYKYSIRGQIRESKAFCTNLTRKMWNLPKEALQNLFLRFLRRQAERLELQKLLARDAADGGFVH